MCPRLIQEFIAKERVEFLDLLVLDHAGEFQGAGRGPFGQSAVASYTTGRDTTYPTNSNFPARRPSGAKNATGRSRLYVPLDHTGSTIEIHRLNGRCEGSDDRIRLGCDVQRCITHYVIQ